MKDEIFTALMSDTEDYINHMRAFSAHQKRFDAKWSAVADQIDDATPEQKAAFERIQERINDVLGGIE